MPRSLAVLTHHACLGNFVTSPCIYVFRIAVWQILACQVSWVSEMWFMSSDSKDIICMRDSSPLPLSEKKYHFKCNCCDLEKMTSYLLVCREVLSIFRFWALNSAGIIIIKSQVDCAKERLLRCFMTYFLKSKI